MKTASETISEITVTHTPTPWTRTIRPSFVEIADANGKRIADVYGKYRVDATKTADEIIIARNSHAALIALLEDAGNVLTECTDNLNDLMPDGWSDAPHLVDLLNSIRPRIDAALKGVRG